MKKIGFVFSILTLIFSSTPAIAAETVLVNIGVDNLNDDIYQSKVVKIDQIGTNNGLPYWQMTQSCTSFSDSKCQDSIVGILGTTILPLCEDNLQSDCIETVGISVADSSKAVPNFVGYAEGDGFAAQPQQGISKGSTSSIYSVSDQSNIEHFFVVTVQIKQFKARKSTGGFGAIQTPYFSVDVKEVTLNSGGQCLFFFESKCVVQKTSERFSAEIAIRLANEPPKWLAGRMQEPKIKFTRLDKGKKVVISGSSVAVPLIEGSVPTSIFAKYPTGYSSQVIATAAAKGTKLEIDSGLAIMYATDVFTALKEKSTQVVNLWNINGTSQFTAFCSKDIQVDCLQGGSGPCVEESKDFVGLLATNALIFNRNPPRLIDDEIQFLLASPHLLPNSKETRGIFTLEASSKMLRCIYGLPDLPLFAEISVVSEDGRSKIATKSFLEKSGVSYISVNNFSFSVPKIKIKFSTAKKSLSITCVKGKVKKVVNGAKPVCPKGYKKIN